MPSLPSSGLPATMRAAVYHGRGRIDVEPLPVPALEPEDVLIEVSHCGICGTDIHLFRDGMGRPGSVGGHEYAGRIAAVGSAVRGFAPGHLVVAGPRESCGRCELCLAGRPVLCDERPTFSGEGDQGAFAEFVRVHASQLFRIPDGLSLRAAALAEPLAVALHAITRSGIQPGQRALVSGAGPLGLLVIAALRARGVEDVTASEPVEHRREQAGRAGASTLVSPEELQKIAMPFDVIPNGFHAAFECSGAASAIETALAQLRRAGILVLVGTGRGQAKLDHHRVLLNELIVTGAFNYDADGFPRALELLASGRLPLDLLIEPDDFALGDLAAAIDQLAAGTLAGKVMIVPNARTTA